MQDWDLICSDNGRIKEFLSFYKTEDLNDDEKFALMTLIIASFDDLAEAGEPLDTNNLWHDCQYILTDECRLHIRTIHYWSLFEEKHATNYFALIEYIRPIRDKVKARFI